MTQVDMDIIKALADNNMNVAEVGKQMFMHRNTVLYHSDKIKEETGLDPRVFYDLIKLLEIVKWERSGEMPVCRMCDHHTMEKEPNGRVPYDYCNFHKKRWIPLKERGNTSPMWCPLRRNDNAGNVHKISRR